MIQHISFWIGEEKLTGPDYDGPNADPYKVQLRAIKRSCVVSIMEQVVNCHADDSECWHFEGPVDCECFTVTNNRIPNRISKAHLMAWRLHFGASNNNFVDKDKSMRMTHVRRLWCNTDDIVMKRNAALLYLKTEDWGRLADDALIRLGNLLRFDVVQVESEARTSDYDDSGDEGAVAAEFGELEVGEARANRTQQASSYNVNEGSIKNEILKFLKQNPSHFRDCKSTIFAVKASITHFLIISLEC